MQISPRVELERIPRRSPLLHSKTPIFPSSSSPYRAMETAAGFEFEGVPGVSPALSTPRSDPPPSSSESSTPHPRFDYGSYPTSAFSFGRKRRCAAGSSSSSGSGSGVGVGPLSCSDEPDQSYAWDSDDEYEKFIERMNPPRVVVDNVTCINATVIQVDSANKYGVLLEVVQVLTDLNFLITKAYVSSDGGWFMEVFYVTDQEGQKLKDESTMNGFMDYIHKSLGAGSRYSPSRRRSVDVAPSFDHTFIELTGRDRPGLLSEVSAILADLECNVVDAEVWTHNTRAAAVMHVTDEATGLAITDTERLSRIKELLCKGGAKMVVSCGVTHTERRLHQMMLADQDYERCNEDPNDKNLRPYVTVVNCYDKDYSVVTICCKDRPKLLFDTVFTLADMKYVVFHASVDTVGPEAYQEFYIRHIDGSPVNSEAEKERVIQCLQAAIERRVSEGLRLELCTSDRVGLLSDVTRIFRENGLTITRAKVATRGSKAINVFYVQGATGNPVDAGTMDTIRQWIGQSILQVEPKLSKSPPQESPARFLFGSLFRSRFLYNLGLVKP